MLPAVASNIAFVPPQQAPLVNTVILGSDVTRVPSFNVAPSVSNEQVDNNTKGNANSNARFASTSNTESEGSASFASPTSLRPAPFIALPTTFLAQLLGQNVASTDDGITQSLLIQYEELVAISNVKYKPSNALKPLPDSNNIFETFLDQPAQPQQDAPQAATDNTVQDATVTLDIASAPQTTATTQQAPETQQTTQISEPVATTNDIALSSPSGVSAYIAADQRNENISRPDISNAESVSDLA